MSSEIMDVEALAAYLHIPRWSVYRLAAAGRLPGAKVGRHWRFHKVLVDEWLIANGRKNLAKGPPDRPSRRARAVSKRP
jgi:excisionase family DNA binding protein